MKVVYVLTVQFFKITLIKNRIILNKLVTATPSGDGVPCYSAAIMLISTFTFLGKPFTATVSLAGKSALK